MKKKLIAIISIIAIIFTFVGCTKVSNEFTLEDASVTVDENANLSGFKFTVNHPSKYIPGEALVIICEKDKELVGNGAYCIANIDIQTGVINPEKFNLYKVNDDSLGDYIYSFGGNKEDTTLKLKDNTDYTILIISGEDTSKYTGGVFTVKYSDFANILSEETLNGNNTILDDTVTNETSEGIVYELNGRELGEYGRIVTLNANSDSPVDKQLYKIPAGTYKVTTESSNPIEFWVVKDETTTEDSKYPEILDYVGSAYDVTANGNDTMGRFKYCVTVTIAEDESISHSGNGTLIFTLVE